MSGPLWKQFGPHFGWRFGSRRKEQSDEIIHNGKFTELQLQAHKQHLLRSKCNTGILVPHPIRVQEGVRTCIQRMKMIKFENRSASLIWMIVCSMCKVVLHAAWFIYYARYQCLNMSLFRFDIHAQPTLERLAIAWTPSVLRTLWSSLSSFRVGRDDKSSQSSRTRAQILNQQPHTTIREKNIVASLQGDVKPRTQDEKEGRERIFFPIVFLLVAQRRWLMILWLTTL